MAEHAIIAGPFAEILKNRRDDFNTRFEAARRANPALLPETILASIAEVARPIAEAVVAVRPDRAAIVASSIYDLLLRLAASGLLGPGARYPDLTTGLVQVSQAAPTLTAQHPDRMLRAGVNAICTLSSYAGVRVQDWIAAMARIAPSCSDVEDFLQAGQIIAWRSGMAHFRSGALRLCRTMNPALVLRCLGIPADDPARLPARLSQLEANPWHDLHDTSPDVSAKTLKVMRRVGGFRGLGGPFLQPPRVFAAPEGFLACDEEKRWLITADCFGATVHPVHGQRPPSAASMDKTVEAALRGHAELSRLLPDRTSAVADGPTWAITTRSSHYVYLVAHG